MVSMIILAIATLVSCSSATKYEKVEPIIFVPTVFTVPSRIHHIKLNFTFIDICKGIPTTKDHPNYSTNMSAVELATYETIKTRCSHLWQQELMYQLDRIGQVAQSRIEEPRFKREAAHEECGSREHTLLASVYLWVVSIFKNRHRVKRVAWLALVPHLVVVSIISCLTHQAIERIDSGSGKNLAKGLEVKIDEFEKKFNSFRHVQDSLLRRAAITEDLIGRIPIYVAELHYHIAKASQNLKMIYYAYEDGRIDAQAISELIQQEPAVIDFSKIKKKDTSANSILLLENNTLNIDFYWYEPSSEVHVMHSVAFNHFANITSAEPVLMNYVGKQFYIFNSTANCLKSIKDPMVQFITDEWCDIANWHDDEVYNWQRATKNVLVGSMRPVRHMSAGNNHIYCYGHHIQFENKTVQCPPSVIRLPLSIGFNTTGITYEPNEILIKLTQSHLPVPVPSMFNPIININENDLIDELTQLKKDIEYKVRLAAYVGLGIGLTSIVICVLCVAKRYKSSQSSGDSASSDGWNRSLRERV